MGHGHSRSTAARQADGGPVGGHESSVDGMRAAALPPVRTPDSPKHASAPDILSLQRSLGNRSTVMLLGGGVPQPSAQSERRIRAMRGSGRPLTATERAFFEPRFGRDFSCVRLHNGPEAGEAARGLNARAFTIGRDIAFARGEYDSTGEAGRTLLAHELAHVVQQRADGSSSGAMSAHTVQRTPGTDAQDSWDSVVGLTIDPDEQGRSTRAQEAIGRMLRLAEGQRLMNQIWQTLCGRGGCQGPPVDVYFVDKHPQGFDAASGRFEELGGGRYAVYVKNRLPPPPGDRGVTIGGSWGADPSKVVWSHGDIESGMANTLYHEMLHVWFVHTRAAAVRTPHRPRRSVQG